MSDETEASPGWVAIKAKLAGLSQRELVTVGKALNGSIGYDYQKGGKDKLAATIRRFAFKYATVNHSSLPRAEAYALTLEAIEDALGNPSVEVDPEEVEVDPEEQVSLNLGDEDAEIAALITALKKRKAAKLDPEMVRGIVRDEIAKQSPTYRVELTRNGSTVAVTDPAPRHEVFPEVLAAVSQGHNVLLVGPAGCGKTHLAEQVANALSMQFGFTGAVSSEYKLLGFTDAQGRTVRTEYRERYEHGGVFLWDELDGSSAAAMLAFNAGLANGHQDFPDMVVRRHADFRAIASANTYGNGADRLYVGRNQLDAASLDRFWVIPIDYDERLERTLFGDGEWTEYVHKARRAVRSLKLRHVVSMRAISMGGEMLAAGTVSRKKVERATLWKHLSDADIAKVKAEMGA